MEELIDKYRNMKYEEWLKEHQSATNFDLMQILIALYDEIGEIKSTINDLESKLEDLEGEDES